MFNALSDFVLFCRVERRLSDLTCKAYERDVRACIEFLRSQGTSALLEVRTSDLRRFLADEATHRPAPSSQARRELLRTLASQREQQKRSQTAIAAAMQTSQSFVARLESTAADAKISTVDRYADSLGFVIQYRLIPTADADGTPPVIVESSSKQ